MILAPHTHARSAIMASVVRSSTFRAALCFDTFPSPTSLPARRDRQKSLQVTKLRCTRSSSTSWSTSMQNSATMLPRSHPFRSPMAMCCGVNSRISSTIDVCLPSTTSMVDVCLPSTTSIVDVCLPSPTSTIAVHHALVLPSRHSH